MERTWDLNTDGAAHYGLVPDWIEDIRLVGGQEVVNDSSGRRSPTSTPGERPERHRAGANLAEGASATASSTE
ncbi:hypothetical protein LT493_10345 [Streptomyces tricolor]|nr:hypothetical protein [Streptomyces tricolor]